MALYFKLLDKQTKEPISLSLLDEKICKEVYETEPHPTWYGGNIFNWFDTIGFQLASGLTLEDGDNSVRHYYKHNEMWIEEFPIIEKVIDYLQKHFICQSWFGR